MNWMRAAAPRRAQRFVLAIALSLVFAVTLLAQESEKKEAEVNPTWKWANFVLLVLGLGYLVSKTVPPYFRSRNQEIQKAIVEARQMKQDADKRAAEVQERMRNLGAAIEKFRAESKAEMEREAGRIRENTAAQIMRLEKQSALEIEAAGTAAQRELKAYAAKLAFDLAEQNLRSQIGSGSGAELADGFIADLHRRQPDQKETRN